MLTIPALRVDDRRHSHVLQQPLGASRSGIMLHYDDSSSDPSALQWFADPRCTNGYTWLVLDDGRVIELADPAMRTPHAGPCLTPMANSRYYGIAAATNGLEPATSRQLASIVELCTALCQFHGWNAATTGQLRARIVGHDEQAVWTAACTSQQQLWGTTGRKVDPTGQRTDGQKVIDLANVVRQVELLL